MSDNDQDEESNEKTNSNASDELKPVYTGDFREIIKSLFKDPINGVSTILANPSNKTFTQAIILYVSVFILYFIGSFILAGELRAHMELSSFFKIAASPVLIMLIISTLSFGIKSILIKANFKNELMCGGLCGIPLALLIPISLILKLLTSSDNGFSLLGSPAGLGFFSMLIMILLILMMVSIFQQSLRVSGTKDTIAWYLSPIAVILSIYLAFKII